MIGCPDSDPHASRARQVVSMMANPDKIFFCGELGNGLAAKISNNYLSGTFLVAIAEAMAIGIRSGVDKNVLAEVIRNSSGNSWMGEHLMPVPGILPDAPSSNGYKPGFRHELMVKDMTLGIEAAKKHGIKPTMASTAVEHCKNAAKDPRCAVSKMLLKVKAFSDSFLEPGHIINLDTYYRREEHVVELLADVPRVIFNPVTVPSISGSHQTFTFIPISGLGFPSGVNCIYFGLKLNQPS